MQEGDRCESIFLLNNMIQKFIINRLLSSFAPNLHNTKYAKLHITQNITNYLKIDMPSSYCSINFAWKISLEKLYFIEIFISYIYIFRTRSV